jgi:hypothetical protein
MSGDSPARLTWPELMSLASQRGARRSRRHPIDITQAGGEGGPPFWSFVQLRAILFDAAFPAGPRLGGLIDLGDHSWVRLELEGDAVIQGGPRRLGDIIEDLFDRWCRLDGPGRERFGPDCGGRRPPHGLARHSGLPRQLGARGMGGLGLCLSRAGRI